MAGLSFTNSGAVPNPQSQLSVPSSYLGGSAAGNALNSAQSYLGKGVSFGSGGQVLKPNASGFVSNYTPPAPSTALKSQTTTTPDGTVNSFTYHPPSESAINAAKGTSQSPANLAYAGSTTNPTVGGVLPSAPTQPLAQATVPPPNPAANPTYNQYTGSTAGTPTQSNSGVISGGNPNSQFQTSNPGNLPNGGNPYVAPLAGAANAANPNSTGAAQGYTSATANYGAGNIPIGETAENIASDYGQKIANVGQRGAQFQAGQLTTGTSPIAEGNAAITGQTTAAQQQALATGETAALQGTQQALTAQNQAAGAANEAAGQATTQQGQTITGLNNAGTLAQPQTTTPGQAVFNPATGQYTSANSTNGNPGTAPAGYDQGVWSQYINDLATNNLGAIPASVTSNPAIFGQLQEAVPGFNYNSATGAASGAQALAAAPGTGAATGAAATAAAPGQTAAQNAITGGTAATQGTAASVQSTIGTYNNMSALNTTANQQAQTVQQVLQSTGLNQGAPAFTKPLNSLAGQLGSDKVTALTSAVTEMQNVYSQLLSSGGTTPSGSEAQALALLSPNSTPQQINAAISQLQTAAYNKLSGQYSQLQTEQSALSSNTNSNASSNTSNPTGWF